MDGRKGISSFSVLLLMAVAAVIGVFCLSLLKIQYTPSASTGNITVRYSYPGASAKTVESEMTSKIEGVLSGIRSCTGISSTSRMDGGTVSLTLDKKADVEAVRFEVASLIRNIYPSLPVGCSYPTVSLNTRGEKSQTAISYSVRSPLPSIEIAEYVEDHVLYPLSILEGVSNVSFYGQTPFEWVITFDEDKAASIGISGSEIRSAIASYYLECIAGMTTIDGRSFSVKLENATEEDFGAIPVKKVGDRVVHLSDLAVFRYQESLPQSYYRINGLNVLILNIEASSDANLLSVVGEVKKNVAQIQAAAPDDIEFTVSYDYSEYISDELHKIVFRTVLCLLILLLFVFVLNRSWRYMFVIAVTLAANLFIAAALYYLTGLHIHIYTLAGITVSLGIIIDNSIVMIDHYSRTRTRSVFPALLCAVATTVAALLAVLLLPEQEKANLTDFSFVIIINLTVSLLVSYLFVPALLDYFPINAVPSVSRVRKLRRTARWNCFYGRYLHWAARHKWVFALAIVAAFGIPTCLIPEKNATWKPYAQNRSRIDRIVGSTFALFNKAMSRSDFYREPQRPYLSVRAGMPEGCTVQQLNEVMRSMENFLAGIDEIDMFETRVSSYSNGTINILFKPEYENTWLPSKIKSDVISMAADFGGANWSVSGIDDSYFNNNIVTSYRSNQIMLSGYNYDELLSYAEILMEHLAKNRRVNNLEIWGSGYRDMPMTEYTLHYDFEALSTLGISPYEYYLALQSPLFSSYVMSLPYEGRYVGVRLESSTKDEFDIWHVDNEALDLGEDRRMKLSQVGSISKDLTGIPIQKENQSYAISVRFDFIGSFQLAEKAINEAIDYMNSEVLPVGFVARKNVGGLFDESKEKFAGLILLVVAMIFVLCAIHFNSLRLPLSIVLMIPVSFIGVFLAFGLSDFAFDKGGFAAFVMLSGITVNAGIYLVSEWIYGVRGGIRGYVKAFNVKIWPISLTILSTILGLVPFFFDGPSEVFWFAFAFGTVSGLVFSILALVFVLPVFALRVR